MSEVIVKATGGFRAKLVADEAKVLMEPIYSWQHPGDLVFFKGGEAVAWFRTDAWIVDEPGEIRAEVVG